MVDKNFNIRTRGIINDLSIRFLSEDISTPIVFEMSDYLEDFSKLSSDISDVAFVIKVNKTDVDTSAAYRKFLNDPEIIKDDINNLISVRISDFTNLPVGSKYYLALGVKFTGDLTFREIPILKEFIQIKQDVIRD